MAEQIAPVTVTSPHALLKPALADLERATPHSRPGDKASLVACQWQETFIMTERYGWLRLPH
jgi:hypothetical protein